MVRRVLYVQFADPAAYPPIEHSSHILAEKGWDVLLLGTDAFGSQELVLSRHPRITLKNIPLRNTGWLLKAQYVFFFFWCLYWAIVWKPAWIYASDPLASPVVWLIRRLLKIPTVYHEHDAPSSDYASSWFMNSVLRYRAKLGRDAELCIIPQRERLADFVKATGRQRPTLCVWNCPRLSEVQELPQSSDADQDSDLIIYYHGSINRQRLPVELIAAAARFKGAVKLRIAGYEVPGSEGYVEELTAYAAQNMAPGIVEFLGIISPHDVLLRSASKAHVGLSLMPKAPDDINLRHMVGASNKSFDCMASGLPLLVTDLREWIETFVDTGYARACDPSDVESIAAQMAWFLEHPEQRARMGKQCIDKIRNDWNYEAMFAGVVAEFETS
jgi:glycosyltransferase involved in cell wall biosynthesis